MTWLQPPGWAHAMIARSWQPLNLRVTEAGDCFTTGPDNQTPVSVSAQRSDDGGTVAVRVTARAAITLQLALPGVAASSVNVTTLAWPERDGVNTPAEPLRIVPKHEGLRLLSSPPPPANGSYSFALAANSFTTLVFERFTTK